jgi:hypothetical protein
LKNEFGIFVRRMPPTAIPRIVLVEEMFFVVMEVISFVRAQKIIGTVDHSNGQSCVLNLLIKVRRVREYTHYRHTQKGLVLKLTCSTLNIAYLNHLLEYFHFAEQNWALTKQPKTQPCFANSSVMFQTRE